MRHHHPYSVGHVADFHRVPDYPRPRGKGTRRHDPKRRNRHAQAVAPRQACECPTAAKARPDHLRGKPGGRVWLIHGTHRVASSSLLADKGPATGFPCPSGASRNSLLLMRQTVQCFDATGLINRSALWVPCRPRSGGSRPKRQRSVILRVKFPGDSAIRAAAPQRLPVGFADLQTHMLRPGGRITPAPPRPAQRCP